MNSLSHKYIKNQSGKVIRDEVYSENGTLSGMTLYPDGIDQSKLPKVILKEDPKVEEIENQLDVNDEKEIVDIDIDDEKEIKKNKKKSKKGGK